jgi:pimeloyl-ACP methyl ester carboxylesterase
MAELEPIVGRYLSLSFDGLDYRIFVEEAGGGIPLLCLHTAGADSRQFRHVLNDKEVARRFRVIAFDFPWHGRSNPPAQWWLMRYRLTTKAYLGIVRAVWQALDLERPVVMGCSMGGAIVLKLAAEYQEELRGIIGLESAAYAPGRYNEFLHHPAIHGGELCASYTYGLCSPFSPEENRRENWCTTASRDPASTRATCISTATTGMPVRICAASIRAAVGLRCSPANTTIPARRR